MTRLTILSMAPASRTAEGLRIDRKFVDGTRSYGKHWEGDIDVVLFERDGASAFSEVYQPDDLPFRLRLLPKGGDVASAIDPDSAVVLASGDDFAFFDLPRALSGRDTRLVYTIEYTIDTRLRIVRLDASRSLPRKLRSMVWSLQQERRRKRAFRAAQGLQANGYPAFDAYRALTPAPLLYLDSRVHDDIFATGDEMSAKAAHKDGGGPLRLLFSGRFETMKGAQDLVPIAAGLNARGVNFTLDIFGTGSLEPEMRSLIAREDLSDRVRIHGPVDYESVLVPHARTKADIFLCCHRQGDPSCSYIENMGCGLPVFGFGNEMWQKLHADADCGWMVPLGDRQAAIDGLARLAEAPDEVARHARTSLDFARARSFEREFERRVDHLRQVAGLH